MAELPSVASPARDHDEDITADPQPIVSTKRVAALAEAERRYRSIAASGGWPSVPREARGNKSAELSTLIGNRLSIEGDLPEGRMPRASSDDLSAALKKFQTRHGLIPNGQIDGQTADVLNVPAEKRLAQIQANLARARELVQSTSKTSRYVLVNVPTYRLEAVSHQTIASRHRVVVGRPERQTPTVSTLIRRINFYPHWHVPDSIAQSDLIPKLTREPEYLAKERFRIFRDGQKEESRADHIEWELADSARFKFRQDPGPWNALGLVRLDMPNAHNVYLHDTPLKNLFRQRHRAFSAGCVRVEGVFDLVAWLLEETPGWNGRRVQDVVAGGNPVDVALATPVPVFFTYFTAWADVNGSVNFRPDVYGRDGMQDTNQPGAELFAASHKGSQPLSP